jgi:hypothetical protein
MSQKNNVSLEKLKRDQSLLTKKIFMKFGNNILHMTTDEWGWFVDPELNNVFNKNKYSQNINKLKHVLIPETIEEYPTIRSLKSMNNFNDEIFKTDKNELKNNTNTDTESSIYVVGAVTIISLLYILILL